MAKANEAAAIAALLANPDLLAKANAAAGISVKSPAKTYGLVNVEGGQLPLTRSWKSKAGRDMLAGQGVIGDRWFAVTVAKAEDR